MLKPIDVGSSVKFSNIEVKFSDDEIARFLNFDRLNRVHRVSNVSGKNESVRSRRRDKRAWRIAKDVILRIQDEPGPARAITTHGSRSLHQQLMNSQNKRCSRSCTLPKIETFQGFFLFKAASKVDELYREFLKGDLTDQW